MRQDASIGYYDTRIIKFTSQQQLGRMAQALENSVHFTCIPMAQYKDDYRGLTQNDIRLQATQVPQQRQQLQRGRIENWFFGADVTG